MVTLLPAACCATAWPCHRSGQPYAARRRLTSRQGSLMGPVITVRKLEPPAPYGAGTSGPGQRDGRRADGPCAWGPNGSEDPDNFLRGGSI